MEPDDDTGAAADGADHLQRAAREVIGAARSFLDAVEELVEDRERLSGVAERIAGAVSDLVDRSSSRSPWGDVEDLFGADEEADEDPDDGSDDGEGATPDDAAAQEDPGDRKVRRIRVD